MVKTIPILLGALLIALTTMAEPIPPLQALQNPINQIIGTLKDPQYQDPSQRDRQQAEIRRTINSIFDFDAIARRAVGRYWKSFSPEERKTFTEAFANLLTMSYVDKIQGEFTNEKVAYLSDERKSPTKSLVKTKIIRQAIEIPVDYSLRLKNASWKIYDVNIEGVSLVKNYRIQFNKILFKKPPAVLIEKVRDKVQGLESKKERAGK